jgi:CRP-like cAMP-binding protein
VAAGIDDVVEAMGQVHLLSGLTPKQLRAVAKLGNEVRHDAGHVLIREGGLPLAFHVVVDGVLEARKGDAVLTRLERGAAFGEMAVIDGEPRSASVVAVTDATTFAIPASEFRHLVSTDPDLAWKLLGALTRRVRALERELGR